MNKITPSKSNNIVSEDNYDATADMFADLLARLFWQQWMIMQDKEQAQ